MQITIDTSALIAVIGNEASNPKIIELTSGCSLCAPASVHWEIGNALSAMFKRGRIDMQTATKALAIYHSIPLKRIDVSLQQSVGIAYGQGIYAYDAYLLQCAHQTASRLLTLDRPLAQIARQLAIATLEVTP
jgi:predicted nucleic acid-binding protein